MLSSIISKKRSRDEISSDHFDVYVPQKNEYQNDELASKFSRLSINNTTPYSSNGYKVYHYKLIDVKQSNNNREYASQISSVTTISKPYVPRAMLDQNEQHSLSCIQLLVKQSFMMNHFAIMQKFYALVESGKIDIDYTFVCNEKNVTMLYLCIENECWSDTYDLLQFQADSTYAPQNGNKETPAALFMKKLHMYEKLTPLYQNILRLIRSQVDSRLEYVKSHPGCKEIQIRTVEPSQDCYDMYMVTAEDVTYDKPEDGLLSNDLLNNADYEMDDDAHQIYVYEEEEENESDDESDSQNRSETWEYYYCSENEDVYLTSNDDDYADDLSMDSDRYSDDWLYVYF